MHGGLAVKNRHSLGIYPIACRKVKKILSDGIFESLGESLSCYKIPPSCLSQPQAGISTCKHAEERKQSNHTVNVDISRRLLARTAKEASATTQCRVGCQRRIQPMAGLVELPTCTRHRAGNSFDVRLQIFLMNFHFNTTARAKVCCSRNRMRILVLPARSSPQHRQHNSSRKRSVSRPTPQVLVASQ